MKLPNKWATDITDKQPDRARKAAYHIVDNKDMDAWTCLIDHEENFFDFVKDKIAGYLIDAVTEDNYFNLFTLMQRYNDWLADVVALSLSKFDNEEINDDVLEYLITGDPEQQAYCAKYFSYVSYPPVERVLLEKLQTEDETLRYNIAQALGMQHSKEAYNILMEKLNSNDDWEKMEGAQLLAAYGDPKSIKPILQAMENSAMKENMASEAATIASLSEYLDTNDEELKDLVFNAIDYILNGLPEILPLSGLFDYDYYECLNRMMQLGEECPENLTGKAAQILFKAKNKFEMLAESDQYTFDEDKQTKEEIEHIRNILSLRDKNFWNKMGQLIIEELRTEDVKKLENTLNTVDELGLKGAENNLIWVITRPDMPEETICHAAMVIQNLKCTRAIPNLNDLLIRINDHNRHEIIKNAINVLEKELELKKNNNRFEES